MNANNKETTEKDEIYDTLWNFEITEIIQTVESARKV